MREQIIKLLFLFIVVGCSFFCVNKADAGVSYNAGTNIITVSGSPVSATGKTGAVIYLADVANGWGVVTSCGTSCFCFDAQVLIGGGTATYAQTLNETWTFRAGSLVNDSHISVNNNAVFQSGELLDATKKTSAYGSTIYSEELVDDHFRLVSGESGSKIKLYSTKLGRDFDQQTDRCYVYARYDTEIYNTQFNSRCYLYYPGKTDTADIYNVQFYDAYNAILHPYEQSTLDNILITDSSTGIIVTPGVGTAVATNVTIKNTTNEVRLYQTTANIYMRDCDLENWAISFVAPGTSTVFRQYSFNCRVQTSTGTPIQGTSFIIEDVNDNIVYAGTTDANGDIIEQILNWGYYSQLIGAGTPIMNTPHEIIINYPGYVEYRDVVLIDDTYSFRIALTEDTVGYQGILNWLEARTMELILGLLCLVFFVVGVVMKHQFLVVCGSTFCMVFGIYWYAESTTLWDIEYALFFVFTFGLGIGGMIYFMTMRRNKDEVIDDFKDEAELGEALEEKGNKGEYSKWNKFNKRNRTW